VVVVGLGYVGLPIAAACVGAGFEVVGVEPDPVRRSRLVRDDSYVEDVSSAALATMTDTGRWHVAAAVAEAAWFDIAVITVPTPLRDDTPDISAVVDASRALAALLRPGGCVILESTTYPGTTDEVVVPILADGSGLAPGVDFFVGFSPERIDPGNPRFGLANTPKVVAGIDAESARRAAEFYSAFVERVVPVSSTRVAELAKLLENTYRHVNIALINELAIFAYELDIDIWEVIDAAATKPFGFERFTPGPGVGGHCLPIDPSYLSWTVRRKLGHPFRFVDLANEINEQMPDYVVRRIQMVLNDRRLAVNGSRLLLLGMAYKRNSGDARESPAVRVARILADLGAHVKVADPLVDAPVESAGERVSLTATELDAADLVVVLTDHDAFDWDLVTDHAQQIFDTRNRLKGGHVVRL
jgi:nucleotide sugar dehydrogenase